MLGKAKNLLERLEALGDTMGRSKLSGIAILAELQDMIELAPAAVQEIYQLEADMEGESQAC